MIASAAGQLDVTSSAFDIIPGGAAELVFTLHPMTTVALVAMQPVEVMARDSQGNTATAFAGTVTIAIGTNPSGGLLLGTTTVTAARCGTTARSAF